MENWKTSYGYKKIHKVNFRKRSIEGKETTPIFGVWGIKIEENGFLKEKELLSVKKLLQKRFKKVAVLNLYLNMNMFLTSKPLEVRMGKGVGSISDWGYKVNKGKVICDINLILRNGKSHLVESFVKKTLEEACLRLHLKTRVVKYRI